MGRTQRQRQQRHKANDAADVADSNSVDFLPPLHKYLSAFGWRNDTQLTVRNFAKTGRGICSKRLMQQDDALIKLPLSSLITIATLESDKAFKELFDASKFQRDERIPFQALLAFYLLHQQHLANYCSTANTSTLEPYLNSIPASFTTPYFCAHNELYCLPETILEKTAAQNRKIRDSFKFLQSHFAATHCDGCGQQYFVDILQLNDFKRFYFAVNSRSVYLNSRHLRSAAKSFFQPLLSDATNAALAPFLDLFNHSDDVATEAELLPVVGTGAPKRMEFVLTLQRVSASASTVASYKQLFISYGALPNLRLITDYGFSLPHNQHDYFEFSLLDIENFIRGEKTFVARSFHSNKFKFIREHNLDDQMFVHQQDGLSHNLRVVLHLIFQEASYYPNILNQVAYGAAEQFDDIDEEAQLLLAFKIVEYKGFIGDLLKLKSLSASGSAALQYMEECVRYLQEYLHNNYNI